MVAVTTVCVRGGRGCGGEIAAAAFDVLCLPRRRDAATGDAVSSAVQR